MTSRGRGARLQAWTRFPHFPGSLETRFRPIAPAVVAVAALQRTRYLMLAGSGCALAGGGWKPRAEPVLRPRGLGGEPRGWPDSRLSPAAATMRRKGTKPSVCRQEDEPPPSPDGDHRDEDPEQPDGAAAAGEWPARTRWGGRGAGDRLTSEGRCCQKCDSGKPLCGFQRNSRQFYSNGSGRDEGERQEWVVDFGDVWE